MLHNKTLFEVLFHRVPSYSFLKPFGCAYLPNFIASSANKLHPCSTHCIFLGYVALHKGYCCLVLDSGHVYVSRHDRFHEKYNPFPHLISKAPHITRPYVFNHVEILHLATTLSSPSYDLGYPCGYSYPAEFTKSPSTADVSAIS